MEQDPRPTRHDAHLEAARRFGERAKAFAQWRRGGHRLEVLRPGGARGGGAETRPASPAKRGDPRSHA